MMSKRLLTRETLARLLRVTIYAISTWRREGWLHARRFHGVYHFSLAEIDRVLNLSAVNYTTAEIPTALDLLEGRERLLTCEEAGDMLGETSFWVYTLIAQGRFAAFKIPHHCIRVTETEVKKRLSLRASREFSVKLVPRVLGIEVRSRTMHSLVQQGKLRRSRIGWLDEESVYALLREALPKEIEPADWIADRLTSPHSLITLAEVRQRLHLQTRSHRFKPILAEEGIVQLNILAITFISEAHIEHLRRRLHGLSIKDLCHVFGVQKEFAKQVQERKKYFCGRHFGNLMPCARTACMLEALQTVANAAVNVQEWYQAQLKEDSLSLVSPTYAARALGLTMNQIYTNIHDGVLPAIRSWDEEGVWWIRQESLESK